MRLMKSRTYLVTTTIGLLSIGVVAVAIPFLKSMGPTAQALNDLPRVKITGIDPGEYRLQNYIPTHGSSDGWQLQLFIYRRFNGDLKVWRLFSKNDAVGMPDLSWTRPMLECRDFGPTVVNGLVDESRPITCHDDNVSDYWKNEWRWTIDGKNMGKMVEDMVPVSGSIEGEFFVIHKRG